MRVFHSVFFKCSGGSSSKKCIIVGYIMRFEWRGGGPYNKNAGVLGRNAKFCVCVANPCVSFVRFYLIVSPILEALSSVVPPPPTKVIV